MSVLTAAEQEALDKWAEIVSERAAIEEFFAWVGPRLAWKATATLSDLLDSFYQIDRRALEAGRQALLRAARGEAQP